MTMATNYTCEFRQFLISKGYNVDKLEDIPIQSRQMDFSGVAVKDKPGEDGKTIQAFALMSDAARCRHRLYPFYRTHPWKNNGSLYPSCSIACKDDNGEWKVYNAHNTTMKRDSDYLDYDNALSRFKKRMDAAPARELNTRAKITCWILAAIFSLYLIARIAFPCRALPLDRDIVTMSLLITVLILLPTLLPLIKSISFFGIDLIIGRE